MNAAEVVNAALSLSEEERREVVNRLLDTLDPGEDLTEGEWLAAWLPEIERRMEESRTNPDSLVPAEVVFAELRKKYGTKK
jgi:putative addiction module component (TIGR02574 family)